MSLQGSFETISLRDVMTLLASSHKSGELRVVGGHVEGRVWLVDGELVASKVGKSQDHADAIFELLRLTEGTFVFKDGVEAAEPEETTPVEPVLREAEARLAEWQDVQRVVPSLEHRVRLIPDLPASDVTLTAEEWHLVMAVALTATVRGVVEELGLSHLEGCRGIKGLVDAGLVLVEPPRVRPAASDAGRVARRSPASPSRMAPRVVPPAATPTFGLTASLLADLSVNGFAEAPADVSPVSFATPSVGDEVPHEPPAVAHVGEGGPVGETETVGDAGTDGMADSHAMAPQSPFEHGFEHHLGFASEREYLPGYGEVSNLAALDEVVVPADSREAKAHDDVESMAVAAPLAFAPRLYSAHVDDVEPDAPEADPPERESGGESINRGLLLKFLSSVRS